MDVVTYVCKMELMIYLISFVAANWCCLGRLYGIDEVWCLPIPVKHPCFCNVQKVICSWGLCVHTSLFLFCLYELCICTAEWQCWCIAGIISSAVWVCVCVYVSTTPEVIQCLPADLHLLQIPANWKVLSDQLLALMYILSHFSGCRQRVVGVGGIILIFLLAPLP